MLTQIFSDKGILIIATIVGMAICSMGIRQVATLGAWLHPLAILAYVIGALILLMVGAALFNIQLPLIDSPRAALIAIIALAVAKVAFTQLHRMFA